MTSTAEVRGRAALHSTAQEGCTRHKLHVWHTSTARALLGSQISRCMPSKGLLVLVQYASSGLMGCCAHQARCICRELPKVNPSD